MGWGEGLDLCELENAPEMQKCPKTFVHDCLKKRWEEKRQFWGVFKPVKVFFRDPVMVRVFRFKKKTDLNISTRYIKVYQRFWSRSKNLETCIMRTHKLEARFYCSLQGRDPFNQNSDRSDREKRTTSKGGPVFFRNFSGWTEPIHWVLDRNFRKFWLNGSRPRRPLFHGNERALRSGVNVRSMR